MRSVAPELSWRWLGRVAYADATTVQEQVREHVLRDGRAAERLLLLEHTPVITLGRRGRAEHVCADAGELRARGIEVCASSRGGEVTYHGPGQLVVYAVVRLDRGVVVHLQRLAQALATVAARLDVPGARFRRAPAGLWLGDRKLAACGLHVRRRVAIHGFALNVTTPPDVWRAIVPCGMRDVSLTSIAEARAHHAANALPPMAEVAALAAPIVCRALGRTPRCELATMKAGTSDSVSR